MSASSGAGWLTEAESKPVRGSNWRKLGSAPEMLSAGVGWPVALAEAPGKLSPTSRVNVWLGVTLSIGIAAGKSASTAMVASSASPRTFSARIV